MSSIRRRGRAVKLGANSSSSSSSSYLLPALAFGVPVGIYSLFLGLSAVPFFQRHFLYAHKINTLLWNDVNKPESWGFAQNQVTPFNLKTADDQSIYAWHILPLPLYGQHEAQLIAQPTGFCEDITQTVNFKLLNEDPTSQLIVYLHGNAGHVAQAIRPASYHALTDTSKFHVLAIDYRGFGHSTGSPTEPGLVLDASAAVDWAMKVAGVSADRIVVLGQSLGTAVASGVAESFAKQGIDFAGVILVAGFSSLPTMLSGYSIAGWVPVLAPLRASPWLLRQAMTLVVDKWLSADRLRETVRTVRGRDGKLNLQLVHAKNDWDIPCHEDDKLFAAAVSGLREMDDSTLAEEKASRTVTRDEDSFVATWEEGGVTIRQELYPHGGHNDIMYYAPVSLAVMRAFGVLDTTDS
ncbi:Alpha/Beta hydrolase protein [Apodospora peruviana]|uniref:Alpha/Beta hydrolase protein n=1 Tax=Apodospora peruviana TaxID=516989 RepID=A0AAE0LZ72_9PEZI|nr:Alpha/Beta hydrolase protein [Apodospora peruviana]